MLTCKDKQLSARSSSKNVPVFFTEICYLRNYYDGPGTGIILGRPKDYDVTIAWTPGHTGIQGNEKAGILAKAGSALNCLGPEPFISIPYASCRAAIKDWSVKR